MQFIVQPVLEKGANHPTFGINASKRYAILNVNTKRVLTDSGGSLVQRPWSESGSQKWKVEENPAHAGYFWISNSATNQRLAVQSQSEGQQVILQSAADGLTQQWALMSLGGATYVIKTASSDLVFDRAMSSCGVDSAGGGDDAFYLHPNAHEDPTNTDQMQAYEARHFILLEVQHNSIASTYGELVQLYSGSGFTGTRRDVALGKYDNGVPGRRFWRLRNLTSRSCLAVDANAGSGTQAVTKRWMSGNAQWKQLIKIEPDPQSPGLYIITEVETGRLLGFDSAGAGNAVKWYSGGSTRWEIRPRQNCFQIVAAGGSNLALRENDGRLILTHVDDPCGDDLRWALEDETSWQVDTTKRYKLYNCHSEKWLTRNADATDVTQEDWNSTDNQLWTFTRAENTPAGRETYYVSPLSAAGKVLKCAGDSSGNPSNTNGAAISLGDKATSGSPRGNENWWVYRLDDGRAVFRARGGDHNLDGNGDLHLWQEVDVEAQKWVLVEEDRCTVDPGKRYVIGTPSGKALTEGADNKVTGEEADNRPEQTWTFQPVSGEPGFFNIVNLKTGRVLDVPDSSGSDGTVLGTWPNNGGNNQQWKPIYRSPNKFTFTAQHSSKALDENPTSGVIQQWSKNDTGAQNFRLKEIRDGRVITSSGLTTLDFSPVSVRSIKVPGPYRVTLYDGPHLTGRSREVTLEDADIGDFNVVSLVAELVAFAWIGTAGDFRRLGIGEYTQAALAELGITSSNVNSIYVQPGMQIELFSEDNFYGDQRVLVFSEGNYSLADVEFAGRVASMRVKAIGTIMPAETLRYGDIVGFRSQRSGHQNQLMYANDSYNILRDDANEDWGNKIQFEIVRYGNTRFRDLVCYGDVIALRSVRSGRYVRITGEFEAWHDIDESARPGAGDEVAFTIVRAGPGTSRTFVSRGDIVGFLNKEHNRYLSAKQKGGRNTMSGQERLQGWEGWRVDPVWPVQTSSSGTRSAGGADVSPLRLTRTEPEDISTFSQSRALDLCGAAACFVDGGLVSICGAAATGIGFCGLDVAAVGVCGIAFAGTALCGVDIAGVGLCGQAASGLAICGADACGAAACGAAACGVAACGAAACGMDAGNGVCGVDACSVEGSLFEACPADACMANACVVNICPVDACMADACLIDLIPIIPGI